MKIKTKRGARRIRNQRVITRRFVTTDYTGCSHITAGKPYECDEGWIEDDFNASLYVIRPDSPVECCQHLRYIGKWSWGVI